MIPFSKFPTQILKKVLKNFMYNSSCKILTKKA